MNVRRYVCILSVQTEVIISEHFFQLHYQIQLMVLVFGLNRKILVLVCCLNRQTRFSVLAGETDAKPCRNRTCTPAAGIKCARKADSAEGKKENSQILLFANNCQAIMLWRTRLAEHVAGVGDMSVSAIFSFMSTGLE
jgi:hypothetical protein